MVALLLYLRDISAAYQLLDDWYGELVQGILDASKTLPMLKMLPAIDASGGIHVTKEIHSFEVEFQNVSFAYPTATEVMVLENVSFSIPAKTVCAIVGKTGSGKTTLVRLLLPLYELKHCGSRGVDPIREEHVSKITVGNVNVAEMNIKSFHDARGYVSQETRMLRGTILSNITYGLDTNLVSIEAVKLACKKANADEFIEKLEEGYETKVGEGGLRLSGGQKQRIALARVFLRQPKLIVLDEATSALDTISEGLVQESIDRLLASRKRMQSHSNRTPLVYSGERRSHCCP